jgi:hypothetical protein
MSKFMPTNYEMDVTNELEVIFTNEEEIKTPEELLIDTIQASFNMGYEQAKEYNKYLRGLAIEEFNRGYGRLAK